MAVKAGEGRFGAGRELGALDGVLVLLSLVGHPPSWVVLVNKQLETGALSVSRMVVSLSLCVCAHVCVGERETEKTEIKRQREMRGGKDGAKS